MNPADYNNTLQTLRSSTQTYTPDKVLNEHIDDAAVFAKNFLGGTGGMLVGDAAKSKVKDLIKGSSDMLEKLNIKPEDMEELADSIEGGDTEAIGKLLAKNGIKIARKKLGSFIENSKGRAKSLVKNLRDKAQGKLNIDADPDAEVNPGQDVPVAQTRINPDVQETSFPTEPKVQETSFDETGATTVEPPQPTQLTDLNKVSNDALEQSGNKAEDGGENLLKGGTEEAEGQVEGVVGKLGKGLDALTEESTALDETPIGLGVTAVLGLASLVSGIFIKTHHDTYTAPPQPAERMTTFTTQQGY